MNKAITTTIPNRWACQNVVQILDDYLERMGPCLLHMDPDSENECTCREEAEVIIVRDYLKKLSGAK